MLSTECSELQKLSDVHEINSLGIYIHFPWCIKKCPYCDFNSYQINGHIPEQLYIQKLLADLDATLEVLPYTTYKLTSIFFGGGTPSLLSGKAIATILNYINTKLHFSNNLEITLEINPGTIEEHQQIQDYKLAGITRISLGAQSFKDRQLKHLQRIHNSKNIVSTIKAIIKENFDSFNIDLMYGLPEQTIADANYDLNYALSFSPPHISWYQLTIEPNTWFYSHKLTTIPNEDVLWEIYSSGLKILSDAKYINYETSAFAKQNYYCHHNLNYWQYGDFLGIGPGAHSKITITKPEFSILRLIKIKNPKNYLTNSNNSFMQQKNKLSKKEIIFEFMLNNLRLSQGFTKQDFIHKTNCNLNDLQPALDLAIKQQLITITDHIIKPTSLGKRFLNDLQMLFIF